MRTALTYLLLFVTVVVLQLFVFDSLHLGQYVAPLVYVAFVILLPLNTRPVIVLAAGLLMGLTMDLFTGLGGLHTVVTLFTAYIRRFVLLLLLGKELLEDGGMPSVKSLERGKFIKYAALMVALHCLCFFTLEALNWKYYYLVLLRAAVSGLVTLLFVWLVSLLFTIRSRKKA